MRPLTQFRLLTAHSALFGLSTAMAGGFVGAYLLKLGLGLPAALATYAALLFVRFGMRFLALAAVRRVGMAGGLRLGATLGALQFVPLLMADDPGWLVAWILVISLSEAVYWPVYHASTASTAVDGGTMGRQIGERMMVGAIVSVVGPLLGGFLLSGFGEGVGFGIAAAVCLLSVLPLSRMARIDAGPVPTAREAMCGLDRRGLATFAADGWIASGFNFAWPMVLFSSIGSSYETFGAANAAAGLIGAGVSLFCGRAIDRGQRDRWLVVVCLALVASAALRAAAAWSPVAAAVANASGAAIAGFYGPVVMSSVYERAKRSGAIYRFHLGIEAGWDSGAVIGLLVAASVAWLAPAASLAVLPAVLGVGAIYLCVRGPKRAAAPSLPSTSPDALGAAA